MVADHEILQREATGAAGWVTAFAYLSVMFLALAFIALLIWGLHRLSVADDAPPPAREASRAERARRPLVGTR
jgi:flagellar biogenesis protein FliO